MTVTNLRVASSMVRTDAGPMWRGVLYDDRNHVAWRCACDPAHQHREHHKDDTAIGCASRELRRRARETQA